MPGMAVAFDPPAGIEFEPREAASFSRPPLRVLSSEGSAASPQLTSVGAPTMALFDDRRRLTLATETDRGHAELQMPLRPIAGDGGAALRVLGSAYRLTLELAFDARGDGRYRWTLDPGGADAAGRARVVDFLIALGGDGVLTVTDADVGFVGQAHLRPVAEDPALRRERAFLTDVMLIEAWAGVRLPLPEQPDPESLDEMAHVVTWCRERRVRMRVSGISALVDRELPPGLVPDPFPLREPATSSLFGIALELGTWHVRVPVELIGGSPEGDRWRARFRPLREAVVARLDPRSPAVLTHASEIESGHLPTPVVPRDTAARTRAVDVAKELVESWDLHGAAMERLRDELRRRWPT